ncbi:ABC transporter ATP-binding protein [Cupriavidus respiraculi]|uniref:ABC transporter ATP-binding protein n=1 Tax=Cupriavidus respiraculi TaxID=195930 RepID=UPI001C968C23|nr:ABC transporter ATP-binding protein [Cupriavidus respiraculi]MBY4949090.1 ABC transporter ATP-binding protein [Cupriavidus respiraculi]
MSSDTVISVKNVSKMYQVYSKPRDRLLQMLFRGRRKYYREFWALHDVSLDVRRGETIGVLGRNGSGKSTLLQMISGTLTPSGGDIEINGKITALLELGAGFNPEFSGRENVFLNASIFGMSRERIEQKFAEIAAFADIGEFIDQPVKTYSSGMYARLAFAVAISLDPEILVVDEILSVGDVFFQARCMRKLDEFREAGGTVFFVTHDTYSVERICTRAIVLDRGRKIFEGATADAVNIYYKMSRDDPALAPPPPPVTVCGSAASERIDENTPCVLPAAEPIPVRRDHVVGDESAYIEDVYVIDEQGSASLNYLVGDWITVKLVVRFSVDFPEIDFGVGIRDRSGTLIGGAHSFYTGNSIGPIRAGERHVLTARIQAELAPGEYLLIAGVARHDSLQSYQECYGLYDFCAISVTGKRKFWGAVLLPSEICQTESAPRIEHNSQDGALAPERELSGHPHE